MDKEKLIDESYNSEESQIVNDSLSNLEIEKKNEEGSYNDDKLKVDINILEKINKLQEQSYYQTLDEVKTEIRVICFSLHEYIESISNNNIQYMQQEIQEIILEFYKDIYFLKSQMMDNLTEFSKDLILSVWNSNYQKLVSQIEIQFQ